MSRFGVFALQKPFFLMGPTSIFEEFFNNYTFLFSVLFLLIRNRSFFFLKQSFVKHILYRTSQL
uniref:Uncharacterized protein n=1 Tax=Anguilla anguilla TaxID=7936 RepID=A0A0E9SQK6_ANGAN